MDHENHWLRYTQAEVPIGTLGLLGLYTGSTLLGILYRKTVLAQQFDTRIDLLPAGVLNTISPTTQASVSQ